MFTGKASSKFETQVHLGLLVIIFVLISLNFISNYITFNARITERKALASHLLMGAIAISRTLPDIMPNRSIEAIEEYKRQFNLSGLTIIPSQPANSSPEARKKWFLDFVHQLPTAQVPDVARKILGADYQTLTRGADEEYFFVYPVPARGEKYLLILSATSSELAYLDDSGDVVLIITIISTLLIISIYYLLARYIFAPFRKLRKQAVESGRMTIESENEAEAVVEDYRIAIAELREKESKLIELNEQIKRRADSLERFNNYLLQSTNSGIVTFDRDGRILSINEAAAKLLSILPEDFIGSGCENLFNLDSEIGKALQALIENRENQPYHETELTLADGSKRSIGFVVSTVSDDRQQSIGASIIITDVNEIISLRQELEAKNRLAALGEMSGGLAHQLRNSMGTIVGFCNLLKKQLTKDEHAAEYLEDLFSEVKETELLVKRFLSFARPLEYHPEEIDLTSLLEEFIRAYRAGLQSKDIEIQFFKINESLSIFADSLLLKQVLNNILDNAVSACEEKSGKIEVSTERTESGLVIAISDSGKGIPPENLAKVFTPFFSSKPSGTGLGLPLASKIVDLHGGRISIESKVNSGTTFKIYLPAKSSPVAASQIR